MPPRPQPVMTRLQPTCSQTPDVIGSSGTAAAAAAELSDGVCLLLFSDFIQPAARPDDCSNSADVGSTDSVSDSLSSEIPYTPLRRLYVPQTPADREIPAAEIPAAALPTSGNPATSGYSRSPATDAVERRNGDGRDCETAAEVPAELGASNNPLSSGYSPSLCRISRLDSLSPRLASGSGLSPPKLTSFWDELDVESAADDDDDRLFPVNVDDDPPFVGVDCDAVTRGRFHDVLDAAADIQCSSDDTELVDVAAAAAGEDCSPVLLYALADGVPPGVVSDGPGSLAEWPYQSASDNAQLDVTAAECGARSSQTFAPVDGRLVSDRPGSHAEWSSRRRVSDPGSGSELVDSRLVERVDEEVEFSWPSPRKRHRVVADRDEPRGVGSTRNSGSTASRGAAGICSPGHRRECRGACESGRPVFGEDGEFRRGKSRSAADIFAGASSTREYRSAARKSRRGLEFQRGKSRNFADRNADVDIASPVKSCVTEKSRRVCSKDAEADFDSADVGECRSSGKFCQVLGRDVEFVRGESDDSDSARLSRRRSPRKQHDVVAGNAERGDVIPANSRAACIPRESPAVADQDTGLESAGPRESRDARKSRRFLGKDAAQFRRGKSADAAGGDADFAVASSCSESRRTRRVLGSKDVERRSLESVRRQSRGTVYRTQGRPGKFCGRGGKRGVSPRSPSRCVADEDITFHLASPQKLRGVTVFCDAARPRVPAVTALHSSGPRRRK